MTLAAIRLPLALNRDDPRVGVAGHWILDAAGRMPIRARTYQEHMLWYHDTCQDGSRRLAFHIIAAPGLDLDDLRDGAHGAAYVSTAFWPFPIPGNHPAPSLWETMVSAPGLPDFDHWKEQWPSYAQAQRAHFRILDRVARAWQLHAGQPARLYRPPWGWAGLPLDAGA